MMMIITRKNNNRDNVSERGTEHTTVRIIGVTSDNDWGNELKREVLKN